MGVHLLKRPAVFLDRDGVINRNVLNPLTQAWESPLSPDQLQLMPGASSAMRALREAGFLLFVVSNQPNAAKAKTSPAMLHAIHDRLLEFLQRDAVEVDAFYYCFHHPHGVVAEFSGPCECRKPSPFFLFQARDQFAVDLESSWMVGDRRSDVECGPAAGVHTIRIVNPGEESVAGPEQPQPEFVAENLAAASAIILQQR